MVSVRSLKMIRGVTSSGLRPLVTVEMDLRAGRFVWVRRAESVVDEWDEYLI